MIFDAHCHIGQDVVFDQSTTEEELMKILDAMGSTEELYNLTSRDLMWRSSRRFMIESTS